MKNKRPLPRNVVEDDRVDFNNEFELVMMRWRYLIKASNPTTDQMIEFEPLVKKICRKLYYEFNTAFKASGMELDDVYSQGMIHLVSFLGNFMEESEGSEDDSKNLIRLSAFITQRLKENARISVRKSQGYNGTPNEKLYFIGDPSVYVEDYNLIKNPTAYGFRSVTRRDLQVAYPGLKIKNKQSSVLTKDGLVVRIIKKMSRPLTKLEYYDTFSTNEYISSPENRILDVEKEIELESIESEFESIEDDKKVDLLTDFVARYSKDPKFTEECTTARMMISKYKSISRIRRALGEKKT